MIRTILLTGTAAVSFAQAAPARAGEAFLGVYAHDIDDGISIGRSPESGAQVIGGYRTERLGALGALGRPRAHVLGAVNTQGGIHFAAAGLSWRVALTRRLYLQPGLGLAVHSGKLDRPGRHLDLGSRVLFEPELSLGWRATDRLALELSWVHLSHAQLAGGQNPGMGDVGLRAVYGF